MQLISFFYQITTNSVGIVRCLASSNDSKLVALAYSSGIISILDLRTGQLLATWKPHEGEVTINLVFLLKIINNFIKLINT